MSYIPVSYYVNVLPGVIGAGSNPLAMNTLLATQNPIAIDSSLQQFSSASAVGDYFGTGSEEYSLASRYFSGPNNSTKKPSKLYITKYAAAATAAFLRGTSLAGLTLVELQAITGTLSITVNGTVFSATVNLSAASSFTNAATLLTTQLALSGGSAVTWDAAFSIFVVTSGTTGALSTMSQGTGAAAAPLGLAAGSLSQGQAADTPAGFMNEATQLSQNFASLVTTFRPSDSDVLSFADWFRSNPGYLYVFWDAASGILTPNNAATIGAQLKVLNTSSVMPIYDNADLAIAAASVVASNDWTAINGAMNFAYRSFSGLSATVDNATDADAVTSNGYNYYGIVQSRGDNVYSFIQTGQVAGDFLWANTYVNNIFLNAQLQNAIIDGLQSVNSLPYTVAGNGILEAWMLGPINEALNNGSIQTGVDLSPVQVQELINKIGKDVSDTLYTQGYYIDIQLADAQTRAARNSPPIAVYYTDGGSIQTVDVTDFVII